MTSHPINVNCVFFTLQWVFQIYFTYIPDPILDRELPNVEFSKMLNSMQAMPMQSKIMVIKMNQQLDFLL